MKHKKTGFSVFAFVAAALTGCTGSTNPETASLFDNINNLNSGEYDRQIAEKDRQAAAIVANNNASQRRIASLKNQQASNNRSISALRGEIASARAQASAARSAIGNNPAKLGTLASYERQIGAIEADMRTGGDANVGKRELRNVVSAIRTLARS